MAGSATSPPSRRRDSIAICGGTESAGAPRAHRHGWLGRCGTFLVLLLALVGGGCSISNQLGSLDAQAKPTAPAEEDLAYARAAAAELLSRGKDTTLPWENPSTGARGTVTPIASTYTQDGSTCHDFLASYVHQGEEAWLEGEACQANHGQWEVRSLKPWRRS